MIPDRIYAQYRNKPKAVAWLNIVNRISAGIASVSELIRISYDIDKATGEQLNIIGRIVVADRSFTGEQPLYPGLFAKVDGAEFGDDDAMFSSLTIDQDGVMSDDLYRLFIKSKIVKNNSDATIDDILYGVNFLLPNAEVLRIVDGENMSFSIEFYGNITELERWALLNASLVPKPQGVRFRGFLEGYEYVEFGDDDTEFGDITAEFVGLTGVK